MLVLTRRQGDRVSLTLDGQHLGEIVIVEGSCRLGFDLLGSVQILRPDAIKKTADSKPLIGPFPHVELPPRGEGYQS